jgi:hypothetical protein
VILRLVAATVALVLTAGAVTGCSDPAGPAEPTPAFTSEAEAFAAAEATYRAYVDALNQVDLSDPETFEDVYAWTTGDANAGERKSLTEMHASGWTVDGDTRITAFVPTRFEPRDAPTVTAEVCTNVEDIAVIDESGTSVVSPDRPPTQSAVVAFDPEPASPTGLLISEIDSGGEACTS